MVGIVSDGAKTWKSYSARFNSDHLDKLTVCLFGSSAAGCAGVTWPANISILVSDDEKMWTCLGDLVRMTIKQGGPRADVYSTYRYATGDLKGAGRHVKLGVDGAEFVG